MQGDTAPMADIQENITVPMNGEDAASLFQLMSGIDPVIRPLIPMFLEQSLLRINALEEARANSDLLSIKKIAHTMKGSSSSYGFIAMANVSREIEDIVKAESVDLTALDSKIRKLLSMHDMAHTIVQQHPDLFQDA